MWPQQNFDISCQDTWWKNLLYVNNLVEPDKMVSICSYKYIHNFIYLVTHPHTNIRTRKQRVFVLVRLYVFLI